MTGSRWENLPEPLPERPVRPAAGWQGFTVDPRPPENQPLRAADSDRDYAATLLQQARLDGRLTPAEHDQRAASVGGARTLGELLPLVGDLMPPTPQFGRRSARRSGRFARAGFAGWAALAVLFNAIWVMTSFAAGRPLYYWPMWPMFFIALPLVIGIFTNREFGPRQPEPPRQLPPGDDLR